MKQPIYTITKACIAYVFTAQFDGMRKPQEWVIYPVKDEFVTIQSGTRIARFSLLTGEGVMSASRQGGAYGVHLSESLGAKPYTFPQALCEAINESPVAGTHAQTTFKNGGGAVYSFKD